VRNEEKFRTTMPQEPTELTTATQLSSNRDIGMNVRYIWIMSIPACSGVYTYQRKPQKRPLGKEYVKWQVWSGLTSVGIETAKETTAATIRMMRVVS
jgi:hypothetical protein